MGNLITAINLVIGFVPIEALEHIEQDCSNSSVLAMA